MDLKVAIQRAAIPVVGTALLLQDAPGDIGYCDYGKSIACLAPASEQSPYHGRESEYAIPLEALNQPIATISAGPLTRSHGSVVHVRLPSGIARRD
jgi:hypothetical protein